MDERHPALKRFRELTDGDGRAVIQRWCEEREQENVHLDFKTISGPFRVDDDKRNLAKALSGFANSDGGLVVWGVSTARHRNVDSAEEAKPIPEARAVLSRLESLTGDAATPLIDGVQHAVVYEEIDGRGILATLVPPSDSGPHMAGLREHRYYKRSGDAFYVLEHFDLEDMFGRRARPRLEPFLRLRGIAPRGEYLAVGWTLGVRNAGRGMARFVQIDLDHLSDVQYRVDFSLNNATFEPAWEKDDARSFRLDASAAIHPGSEHDVCQLTLTRVREGHWGDQHPALWLRCCAAGVLPRDLRIAIDHRRLALRQFEVGDVIEAKPATAPVPP